MFIRSRTLVKATDDIIVFLFSIRTLVKAIDDIIVFSFSIRTHVHSQEAADSRCQGNFWASLFISRLLL